MSIHQTIRSLYAIMCAAQDVCKIDGRDTTILQNCLRCISDEDVNKSLEELTWALKEISEVSGKLKGMYILHYTTGTDKENKNVVLETECVFGPQVIKFATMFDPLATQSLIDALSMSLAMTKAGNRLSVEGHA